MLNKIFNEDCLEGMKKLDDNSVDLVLTSPPYNIGKEYETKIPIEDYLSWSESYLSEIYRILKNGRSFMFQVGIHIDKETNSIPLSYLVYPIISKIGFKLRQEIVWSVKGGMQAKKKLTGQHEIIMWLYKGKELPYFDLDSIRVKEWKSIDKRNNPNGKNPTNVWDINRVAGNSKEKVGHPCQFPVQMIERITKGWSKEGDIILDPFMGSGTTAIACLNTNRNYIGFELDSTYHELATQRVKSYLSNTTEEGN
ncbi:DNA-methyltransferase [Bacillus cereus]|uniref:DNA-methyltransferase n=1 Tax=Bacillus cereus TaxID=1396 RepID=UPI000BF2DA08|nr:site-specific DNA-methyltransferase [Bacillus cereus]PEZ63008.1 site-specific DNA-methyltransferase [Bacillus cereus]